MASENYMSLQGKDVGDSNKTLTINLADDVLEVRGFGQPITREKAIQMTTSYLSDIEAAARLAEKIETDTTYEALKNDPDFIVLKALISPSAQTVSGVFGKEIILQILAMSHCEGIRYIVGKDDDEGKNTIILIGVTDDGIEMDEHGNPRAKSVPVKIDTKVVNNISVDGEVHKASLNLAQTRAILSKHSFLDTPENRAKVIFGSY